MDVAHAFFDLPSDYKIGLKRSMERLGLKPIGEPHRAVTDAVSAMMVFESIKGITDR
jgi:inhibitor of KinA sporulation pathway (predicted exonuclease)